MLIHFSLFLLQEHVVHFVFKLLTPPPDSSASGARNHFMDHMPVLSAVLFGVCCVDTVHILSLYGMVSEAVLFPIANLMYINLFPC